MSYRIACILILCLLAIAGCSEQPSHRITPSIYYWKTVYAPTAYERGRWNEHSIGRIYVRCFDVVHDAAAGKAKPVGIIRRLEAADQRLQHIPVVFITPEVLRRLTQQQTTSLADNISALLEGLFAGLPAPDEVQIDCDWTTSTRDAYFSLLRALREQPFFKGKTLSATIRLHQVKYRLRSGIPPVDRGLLMCYNMGSMKRPGPRSSILDVPLAKDYLRELEQYPLPLDAALPLFSWCLQFRDGKLSGILRDVPPEAVAQSALFRRDGANLYRCTADTVWMGYPFYSGDVVRTERAEGADVREMAAYMAKHIRNDSLRVVLFHSDSLTLSKYPDDEIQAIFGAYR